MQPQKSGGKFIVYRTKPKRDARTNHKTFINFNHRNATIQ